MSVKPLTIGKSAPVEFAEPKDTPVSVAAPRAAEWCTGAPPLNLWTDGTAGTGQWLDWLRSRRPADSPQRVEELLSLVSRIIVLLDEAITSQVNQILHHGRFQRLESSWRGLRYLVDQVGVDGDRLVKIRVLNASWKDLARDSERATEFDGTALFQKVYEEEFGAPGGEPFGLLVGDYAVSHQRSADSGPDDVDVLRSISGAAAAAFAPFVCGVDPACLGLESFGQLERRPDLHRLFQSPDYAKWHALRRAEDSRFLGLTLPRVLMRLPYERTEAVAVRRSCRTCGEELQRFRDGSCDGCGTKFDPWRPGSFHIRRLGFRFAEEVDGPDASKYLWGSAAFSFAAVVIRTFIDTGWLADIRGFDRNVERGGLVKGLAVHTFGLDAPGVAPKMSTEVAVDGMQDKALADQGFIPLCHCHDTDLSVFFANPSVHKPIVYDDPKATLNARISAMLQYTLCVSRFAHYLKVQARERIGSAQAPGELADKLRDWINNYVTPDELASAEVKAKFPLREAEVQVREVPGRPGTYQMVMKLWPHYQLDDLLVSVRFVTRVDRVAG